jgi:hypothetical protein
MLVEQLDSTWREEVTAGEYDIAVAIVHLFIETCDLRRALAQYEPGIRRGLPSPHAVRRVMWAKEVMKEWESKNG